MFVCPLVPIAFDALAVIDIISKLRGLPAHVTLHSPVHRVDSSACSLFH